mmetsp:Transcript_140625/g.244857  ORF Transcript_140625/g.244857 Transcript_140625/m.244857 type:complete len:232 (+) Transcript_140625:912-1607(+)
MPQHGGHVGAVHDQLAGQTLVNLDDPGEHPRVVVQLAERGDGEDLGDGAEAEHAGVPQGPQVLQALRDVLQGVVHQVVEAPKCRRLVRLVPEGVQVLRVLTPHLLRPEHPRGLLLDVLQVVPDDVDLLQEQPHGVGDVQLRGQHRRLRPRGEDPAQAMPNQPRDVVTVLLILGNGFQVRLLPLRKLGHPRPHSLTNVHDRLLVLRGQGAEDPLDTVEVLKKLSLMSAAHAV